jgi:hypothetical protein
MKTFLKLQALLPLTVLVVLLGMVASPAVASASMSSSPQAVGDIVSPGNYCISCHLASDPRLSTATDWKGAIGREVISPCPAATEIHKELYYTERMLLMIDRAQRADGQLFGKNLQQLEGYTQAYSRQLDQPVTSLDAFAAEAQNTRYRLNKVYSVLTQMADAAKKRTVILFALAATLIVFGSLVWGLFNTRSYNRNGGKKYRTSYGAGLLILLVIGLFTMPLFRVPAAEVVASTMEQQEALAVRDTADRVAVAADRGQARAWMLARLGAAWNAHDTSRALGLLGEAVRSVEQVQANQDALWGQSLAVQEVGVGTSIELEKGVLISQGLNAARARMWSLPLIAVEWNAVASQPASTLLWTEQQALQSQSGIYRDLQMRSIALAWALIDPSTAAITARGISDPATRSWTQRELGFISQNPSEFSEAADSARSVADPIQRSRALRELAMASGDRSLFEDALAALDKVTGPALAYSLSDLASASGDVGVLEDISPQYPDALTYALLRMAAYDSAWAAALEIPDPVDQARAQAAVASAAGDAELAMQIEFGLYRDLALRDITRKTGNVALTDSIGSVYYKVQALTGLGELQAAAQEGASLTDGFPLVELSLALAKSDPQTALELMKKMSREADKAVVLRAIAAATGDQALFEQALGMALAARVRGDALAPAQASLDLANALWEVSPENAGAALRQADDAAQKISIK